MVMGTTLFNNPGESYTKDKLTSITHNGFQYGFAYDGFGNPSSVSVAGNTLASYKYKTENGNHNGNLDKMTYGNGDVIQYDYDKQDRLTEEKYGKAGATAETIRSYVYDAEGNLYKVKMHKETEPEVIEKEYTLSYDQAAAGDANGDGKIDAFDYAMIKRCFFNPDITLFENFA